MGGSRGGEGSYLVTGVFLFDIGGIEFSYGVSGGK